MFPNRPTDTVSASAFVSELPKSPSYPNLPKGTTVELMSLAASGAPANLALSDDFADQLTDGIFAIILYAVIGLALTVVGFYAIDLTTPGKLRELIRAGKPNACLITAVGLVSMAFIVVLAIFGSGGDVSEGVIYTIVFGLLGIVAQIGSVRVLDLVTGIDLDEIMNADEVLPQARVIAAAHIALGLVVAFAIF